MRFSLLYRSHFVYHGFLLFPCTRSMLRNGFREILQKFQQSFHVFFGPLKISEHKKKWFLWKKNILHISWCPTKAPHWSTMHSHGTSKASNTLPQLYIHNTLVHIIHIKLNSHKHTPWADDETVRHEYMIGTYIWILYRDKGAKTKKQKKGRS